MIAAKIKQITKWKKCYKCGLTGVGKSGSTKRMNKTCYVLLKLVTIIVVSWDAPKI